jgi:hypothetical protein
MVSTSICKHAIYGTPKLSIHPYMSGIDNAQAAEEAFDNTETLVLALAAMNSHLAF